MNAPLFPWIPSLRRKKSMKKVHQTGRITAITNARNFDGERVINDQTVVINGASISAVGGAVPAGAALVNAQGATLMPGLIDAHVHTSLDGLRDALAFGVTTELEMQGHWTDQDRKEVAEHDDIADIVLPGWASPLQADTPVNCFLKARTLVMMPTIIPPKTVRDTASSLHSHRPRRKRLISWTNSSPTVLTISRL